MIDGIPLQTAAELGRQMLDRLSTVRLAAVPAMALTGLYGLLWVVCWIRRPERGHGLRLAWMGALVLLWIVTAVLGWKFGTFVYGIAPELEVPLYTKPMVGFSLAALLLLLMAVRWFRVTRDQDS